MRKIYLIISFILLSAFSVFAQPIVNIPDPNLSSALVGDFTINVDANGYIDSLEAASYTGGINVAALSINDMTGIEAFTSAVSLNFSSNPGVTSVNLPPNTFLTTLDCYNCNLAALDVSANTGLTSLNCAGNNIASLDVSSNVALQNLFCMNNQLTAFDVSNNTALLYLDCSSNLFTTLDVSNNTSITNLYCNNLSLTSLDVSAFSNLV